jgi:hypothetical protein
VDGPVFESEIAGGAAPAIGTPIDTRVALNVAVNMQTAVLNAIPLRTPARRTVPGKPKRLTQSTLSLAATTSSQQMLDRAEWLTRHRLVRERSHRRRRLRSARRRGISQPTRFANEPPRLSFAPEKTLRACLRRQVGLLALAL